MSRPTTKSTAHEEGIDGENDRYYKRRLFELQQRFDAQESVLRQEIAALRCQVAELQEFHGVEDPSRHAAWPTMDEPNIKRVVIGTLKESSHRMQSLMNALSIEREKNQSLRDRLSLLISEDRKLRDQLSLITSEHKIPHDINDELESEVSGHDSNGRISTKNGEIAFQEELRTQLLATKRELTNKISSNYSTRSLLEKQLQNTLITQDEEREKLSYVMQRQKSDLEFLQREYQDLEEKVFEAMRKRDQKRKDIENINTRITKLRALKSMSGAEMKIL